MKLNPGQFDKRNRPDGLCTNARHLTSLSRVCGKYAAVGAAESTGLPTEKSCGQGFELEIAETQPLVAACVHPEILYISAASILISDEESLSKDSCGWC
jgi:hypothetical protein